MGLVIPMQSVLSVFVKWKKSSPPAWVPPPPPSAIPQAWLSLIFGQSLETKTSSVVSLEGTEAHLPKKPLVIGQVDWYHSSLNLATAYMDKKDYREQQGSFIVNYKQHKNVSLGLCIFKPNTVEWLHLQQFWESRSDVIINATPKEWCGQGVCTSWH